MPTYDKEEVLRLSSCEEYLRRKGYETRGGRCAAMWRGGDNPNSVSLEGNLWHDFKASDGGDIFALVDRVEPGMAFPEKCTMLGEMFGATPRAEKSAYNPRKGRRFAGMIAQGFTERAVYEYRTADGAWVYSKMRLERDLGGRREKTFIQWSAEGCRVPRTGPHPLYNLPAVAEAEEVWLAEGEKDADTLIKMGLCGASMDAGAGGWREEYADELRGKRVIILADNDEKGQSGAAKFAARLDGVAASVRVITPSSLPKGDVTDWVAGEGGTRDALVAMAEAAPAEAQKREEREAEKAQKREEREAEKAQKREERKERMRASVDGAFANVAVGEDGIMEPLAIGDITDHALTLLHGFPRKVAGTLFIHEDGEPDIRTVCSEAELFAAIARKSGLRVHWENAPGTVPRKDLFANIEAVAREYERVSKTQEFPMRDGDTYYTCGTEVRPTPGHEAFEGLVSRFCPAEANSAAMLRVLFAAPCYSSRVRRPAWMVDSVDGANVGKTFLAEAVARLYGGSPIRATLADIDRDRNEVMSRLLSPEAASRRVFLLDNVTGTVRSPNLAEMITSDSFSGRPKYGRGEATRQNDLTVVLTSNSAQADNDLATRCMYVDLRRPDGGAADTFARDTMAYIDARRGEIIADIIDILRSSPMPVGMRAQFRRCPEFDREVAYPMVGAGRYEAAMAWVREKSTEANTEDEDAGTMESAVTDAVAVALGIPPDTVGGMCLLLSNRFIKRAVEDAGLTMDAFINAVKGGRMPCFLRSQSANKMRSPATRKPTRCYAFVGERATLKAYSVAGATSLDRSVVGDAIASGGCVKSAAILAELRRRGAEALPEEAQYEGSF